MTLLTFDNFTQQVQVKNEKVNAMFDSASQCNMISKTLVDELGLEIQDLVQLSSLTWLQGKYVMKISQRCKIKFAIDASYVDEVECEVVPLDTCEVMFNNPYLWDNDDRFYMRDNKYHLVKGDKVYLVKAHQRRDTISPTLAMQGKTRKQQATLCSKRMVEMTKQMEAMCFNLLHGPTFGDQKSPNGEV